MSLPYDVICLMGPTGAGKTDLAIALVQQFPCEIISVDSAMVYRGMDIGTAKPDKETLAKAPHRLIDLRDPAQSYSAADFVCDARREIEAIRAEKRIPLLVGGTMLYFRALLQGLADLPSADESIRQQILQEAKRQGWPKLHERLQEIDPVAAEKIHPNDSQRIGRALEIYEITGTPMTSVWEQQSEPMPVRSVCLAVAPSDRALLHQRIATRFHAMLEQGLIEEVRTLHQRDDLNLSLPSMRAVGYRQVWEYLDGLWDKETLCEKAIIATRQLAKRQLTWLRSWPDLHTFESTSPSLKQDVLNFLS